MRETTASRGNRERAGGSDDVEIDVTWEDLRPQLVSRWSRLSDNDLEALGAAHEAFVRGDYQLLLGRLRERYGIEERPALEAIRAFVRGLVSPSPARSQDSQGFGQGFGRSSRD